MDPSLRLRPDIISSLSRAKAYPYDIPKTSYAFLAGMTLPLVTVNLRSPLDSEVIDDNRACTLRESAEKRGIISHMVDAPPMHLMAYGSNASHQGLTRKFSQHRTAAVLPVARASLRDFDIVYSSHISPYGAIPAALQYCPGAQTTVHVLVATQAQRRILRDTEPNYIYARLSDLDIRLDLGPALSDVGVYLTRHGMLTHNGAELGLAVIKTEHRRFPSATEEQALEIARDMCAPGLDLDSFVIENIRNETLSIERTVKLKESARPFAYERWEELHE